MNTNTKTESNSTVATVFEGLMKIGPMPTASQGNGSTPGATQTLRK